MEADEERTPMDRRAARLARRQRMPAVGVLVSSLGSARSIIDNAPRILERNFEEQREPLMVQAVPEEVDCEDEDDALDNGQDDDSDGEVHQPKGKCKKIRAAIKRKNSQDQDKIMPKKKTQRQPYVRGPDIVQIQQQLKETEEEKRKSPLYRAIYPKSEEQRLNQSFKWVQYRLDCPQCSQLLNRLSRMFSQGPFPVFYTLDLYRNARSIHPNLASSPGLNRYFYRIFADMNWSTVQTKKYGWQLARQEVVNKLQYLWHFKDHNNFAEFVLSHNRYPYMLWYPLGVLPHQRALLAHPLIVQFRQTVLKVIDLMRNCRCKTVCALQDAIRGFLDCSCDAFRDYFINLCHDQGDLRYPAMQFMLFGPDQRPLTCSQISSGIKYWLQRSKTADFRQDQLALQVQDTRRAFYMKVEIPITIIAPQESEQPAKIELKAAKATKPRNDLKKQADAPAQLEKTLKRQVDVAVAAQRIQSLVNDHQRLQNQLRELDLERTAIKERIAMDKPAQIQLLTESIDVQKDKLRLLAFQLKTTSIKAPIQDQMLQHSSRLKSLQAQLAFVRISTNPFRQRGSDRFHQVEEEIRQIRAQIRYNRRCRQQIHLTIGNQPCQ